MNAVPTVALFNDLSGIGRCALSVALPTLSVMGVQPCALPTALLSAHTGFAGVSPVDQSAFLDQALGEWAQMDRAFDGVTTGYLASPRQAQLLAGFVMGQRQRGLRLAVVDPAMGDHGRLYRAVSPQMPAAMAGLCAAAHVIVPNPTEAMLLTGQGYLQGATPPRARALLTALLGLGCQSALITGLQLAGGQAANVMAVQGVQGLWACRYQPLPCAFPGTGDLFAAALTGFLITGCALSGAMAKATAFVYAAMARTLELGTPPKEGVAFEPLLGSLARIAPMPVAYWRGDEGDWDDNTQ